MNKRLRTPKRDYENKIAAYILLNGDEGASELYLVKVLVLKWGLFRYMNTFLTLAQKT